MTDYQITPEVTRNPDTHESHRREVFWQITFPVILGALILLTFSVLTITLSVGNKSVWADISLIWLIIPALFFSFLVLLLLIGGAYAVIKLIEVLPLYARRLHIWLVLFGLKVGQVGDAAVKPFVKIQGLNAQRKYLGRRLRGK